jgi:AcrR family transcriptional regulator
VTAEATAPATPRTRASNGAALDGRRAWRDRNLNAVVDALLDLFAEGNLRPGADAIAARSGVSRRSVFRYFADLDSLDRIAIDRQLARVGQLAELERVGEGSLDARIDRIVAQRIRLYDAVLPVARVSRLRAPFEPVVAAELARTRRLWRRQIERHFAPELQPLARRERNAVLGAADVVCAFECYELMRLGHGQSSKQVADAMRVGLTKLFAAARRR